MSSIIENVRENHEKIMKALNEKYETMNMKEIETFQMIFCIIFIVRKRTEISLIISTKQLR